MQKIHQNEFLRGIFTGHRDDEAEKMIARLSHATRLMRCSFATKRAPHCAVNPCATMAEYPAARSPMLEFFLNHAANVARTRRPERR